MRLFREALDNLDKSAIESKEQMDSRSMLSYNLVFPLDQMDIQMEGGDSLRRVDWLVGRNEACRWLCRTNYRTEAIQLSLASCGRFMRYFLCCYHTIAQNILQLLCDRAVLLIEILRSFLFPQPWI